MKSKYEKPDFQISEFNCTDVITLSSIQTTIPTVDAESLDGYFSEDLYT